MAEIIASTSGNRIVGKDRVLEAGTLEYQGWSRFYDTALAEAKGENRRGGMISKRNVWVAHEDYLSALASLACAQGDNKESQRLLDWKKQDKIRYLKEIGRK